MNRINNSALALHPGTAPASPAQHQAEPQQPRPASATRRTVGVKPPSILSWAANLQPVGSKEPKLPQPPSLLPFTCEHDRPANASADPDHKGLAGRSRAAAQGCATGASWRRRGFG